MEDFMSELKALLSKYKAFIQFTTSDDNDKFIVVVDEEEKEIEGRFLTNNNL